MFSSGALQGVLMSDSLGIVLTPKAARTCERHLQLARRSDLLGSRAAGNLRHLCLSPRTSSDPKVQRSGLRHSKVTRLFTQKLGQGRRVKALGDEVS